MPIEDRMTVDERRKYLKLMAPRYVKAGMRERRELLTEMQAVTGLHRKSLLRLLHGPTLNRAPKRPRLRRRRYGAVVAGVVRVVWESLGLPVCRAPDPGTAADGPTLSPVGRGGIEARPDRGNDDHQPGHGATLTVALPAVHPESVLLTSVALTNDIRSAFCSTMALRPTDR